MLRSKSRSGSSDFVRKKQKSVLFRTIYASKLCRGDPLISQIDSNALKPVERSPSKVVISSEKHFGKDSTMQQNMSEAEKELTATKEQLDAAREERDRALDVLHEMKMVAQAANMKLSEAISSPKAGEACSEIDALKKSLLNLKTELDLKDKNIKSLELELDKAKQFEVRLAERDVLFDRLKEELSDLKASEVRAMGLVSESKKGIQELKDEIERGKLSETQMFDSVVSQTKELEQTKIELEESKIEVASLREKTKKLEVLSMESNRDLGGAHKPENVASDSEAFGSIRAELQSMKERLALAQEGEKVALSKAESLLEETDSLKSELKLAIEAEEKNKKAMDDLALALKEVATEANQMKDRLCLTEEELEHVKREAEKLKVMVRSTEDKYQKVLDKAKKESELHKNTVERLRLEAEESLLAWNDKEVGFVKCIKSAEDERALAQEEKIRLIESLKEAKNLTKASREENFKLRDILKQALNEANVAKEAASIAKAENAQLQDSHAAKDEAIDFLTRENENLRIKEAAANDSIKELQRLLSAASTKESRNDDKDQGGSTIEESKSGKNKISGLTIPNERGDENEKVVDKDPDKAKALEGSILFDTAGLPSTEPHAPFGRTVSASSTNDAETINSEGSDHLEGSHSDDDEDDSDRSLQMKKNALLRRFGDVLKRRTFH